MSCIIHVFPTTEADSNLGGTKQHTRQEFIFFQNQNWYTLLICFQKIFQNTFSQFENFLPLNCLKIEPATDNFLEKFWNFHNVSLLEYQQPASTFCLKALICVSGIISK